MLPGKTSRACKPLTPNPDLKITDPWPPPIINLPQNVFPGKKIRSIDSNGNDFKPEIMVPGRRDKYCWGNLCVQGLPKKSFLAEIARN